MEYLLSPATEVALANAPSRQIPLGPVDASQLSEEVRHWRQWAPAAYPIGPLVDDEAACLAWLKKIYTE